MTIPAGPFTVELGHVAAQGSTWVVTTWRKRLFGRKRISTDWFLEKPQAEEFARRLARELEAGATAGSLKKRKPGWGVLS
jgi:hypothetical protein